MISFNLCNFKIIAIKIGRKTWYLNSYFLLKYLLYISCQSASILGRRNCFLWLWFALSLLLRLFWLFLVFHMNWFIFCTWLFFHFLILFLLFYQFLRFLLPRTNNFLRWLYLLAFDISFCYYFFSCFLIGFWWWSFGWWWRRWFLLSFLFLCYNTSRSRFGRLFLPPWLFWRTAARFYSLPFDMLYRSHLSSGAYSRCSRWPFNIFFLTLRLRAVLILNRGLCNLVLFL